MDDITDFELEGFFKVESLNIPLHVEERFGDILNIFRRLNCLAWSLQYKLKISEAESDIRLLWCIVLYSRTLNFIQAATMLATKGMKVQADAEFRCSLDTLFKLGALANVPELITDYAFSEQSDILKHLNSIIGYLKRQQPRPTEEIRRKETELEKLKTSLIKSLKQNRPSYFDKSSKLVKIENILSENPQVKKRVFTELKKINPEIFDNPEKRALSKIGLSSRYYASKANLIDMYDTWYRLGSTSIHSDATSLEKGHLEINENGIVNALKNEPHFENFPTSIISYCTVVTDAVKFVCQALNHKMPNVELKVIEKELDDIACKDMNINNLQT